MIIFVGVRELSNKTKSVLSRLNSGDTIIVTDKGQPKAAMIGIGVNHTFEEVYEMVKDYELDQAFNSIHKESKSNPNKNMSMGEINQVISNARSSKKRKTTK